MKDNPWRADHAVNNRRFLGRALALTLLPALLLVALLHLTAGQARANDDEFPPGTPISFTGTVEALPGSNDLPAEWGVEDLFTDVDHVVVVGVTTTISNGLPTVGQIVRVTGVWAENDRIEAHAILLVGDGPGGHDDDDSGDDDGDDDGEDALDGELSGYLVSRPDAGIGTWVVQCRPLETCSVVVTTTTVLEDGVIDVGLWVEADGVAQDENTLLANRVRLDDYEQREVVVRLEPSVVVTDFALLNDLVLVDTLLASANIHLFQTLDDEDDAVAELMDEDGVVWAELNYLNSIPDKDGYKTWRWGGEDAAAAEAYRGQSAFDQVQLDRGLTVEQGAGIIVAVLDTGVYLDHPVFAGRLLPGRDVVSDDATPRDDGPGFGWGHGTHVAGVVARMAPQAKLLPVRVLDANGRGNTFTLAYAIEWAVNNGADVINLSLGAESGSRILEETVAWAAGQGVVIVAAAGNEFTQTVQVPAGLPGVIAVASVDSANLKAGFSNYGEWVDIAAPGVGITSSVPFTAGTAIVPAGAPLAANNPGYAAWSGTSMSTAFVSGAAALLRSHGIAGNAVEATLSGKADSLAEEDPVYGALIGGLLNVARSLDLPDLPPPPPDDQHELWLPLIGR